MRSSQAWRVTGATWLPDGNGYEDWYLLDDTCALETIQKAAVSGNLQHQHDLIAAFAAGGTAGLYRPALVPDGWTDGAISQWFGKPPGVTYAQLYQQLPIKPAGLWQRMMVLGPTPEFCALQDGSDSLPQIENAIVVHRSPIWP